MANQSLEYPMGRIRALGLRESQRLISEYENYSNPTPISAMAIIRNNI